MNQHAQAAPPSRGLSMVISWGLVTIPVKVLSPTTEIKSVPERSMFSPEGNPVQQKLIDAVTNEEVSRDDCTKKTEWGERWLPLTDEEIAETCGGERGVATMIAAVPLESIGSIYKLARKSSPELIRPALKTVGKSKVVDPAAHKALSLLLATLEAAGKAALVYFKGGARGARYGAILPDGTWWKLSFASEVAEELPLDPVECSDAEIAMGKALLATLPDEPPVLVDETHAKFQALLQAKADGTPLPKPDEDEVAADVVDLMGALAASLEAAGGAPKPAKKTRAKKAS